MRWVDKPSLLSKPEKSQMAREVWRIQKNDLVTRHKNLEISEIYFYNPAVVIK